MSEGGVGRTVQSGATGCGRFLTSEDASRKSKSVFLTSGIQSAASPDYSPRSTHEAVNRKASRVQEADPRKWS
jgi:hypothetical protein